MNRALFAAASGMAAEQEHLDAVAANLANADITAFAGQLPSYATVRGADGGVLGVAVSGRRTEFTQGRLERSGGPCDVALHGPGFFVVRQGAQTGYTRAGSFHRTAGGRLETAEGWHLPGITVPAASERLQIDPDGLVKATLRGGKEALLGRVRVAEFGDPQTLRQSGQTTFIAGPHSGAPHFAALGQPGAPEICFGELERSNVSIVAAMMEILDAQRAYEADAKGVQAADEMVRIANNLQRG